jgi:hypothetical protein
MLTVPSFVAIVGLFANNKSAKTDYPDSVAEGLTLFLK